MSRLEISPGCCLNPDCSNKTAVMLAYDFIEEYDEEAYISLIKQDLDLLCHLYPFMRGLSCMRRAVLLVLINDVGLLSFRDLLVFIEHIKASNYGKAADSLTETVWGSNNPIKARRFARILIHNGEPLT